MDIWGNSGILGVSKRQDKGNRWDERSILDKGVSWVVFGCNNRQTSEYSWPRLLAYERNTWICEPNVSSNDAGLHSQLPQNRFLSYPFSFRRVLHNRECHRAERHLSSIVWLVERVPGRLAWLHYFLSSPHPNSTSNVCLDLLWLGCRFRFFLLDKGIHLVQFSYAWLLRYLCRRQFVGIGSDPIRNGLWTDLQDPANRSLTAALHIHSNG